MKKLIDQLKESKMNEDNQIIHEHHCFMADEIAENVTDELT